MSAVSVQTPFPIFNDIDGQPLEAGYIFVGVANLDPQVNPVAVFFDEALTQPAGQPIRTIGGYAVNSGTPTNLYSSTDYSIRVTNKNGSVIYSAPVAQSYLTLPSPFGSSLVGFIQSGAGAVARTAQGKLREIVSVKDFGAVGDGVVDDTSAIQSAMSYASTVVTSGANDTQQVLAAVYFPGGKYRTTAAIEMFNNVSIQGDGTGTSWVLVDHTGDGFFTADGRYYANIHVTGLFLQSAGTARDGFNIYGQIRNCHYHDVGLRGFRHSFQVAESWTIKFDQCFSFNSVRHFNFTTGSGGVHIYGGRYDVASDHGVFVNAVSAELIMQDVAVQFGQKSAVRVENCYTVELNQCFFEGNCIGSATDYYVHISNSTTQSLSSATVTNCVMNNLADNNRNGLGVLFIENIVAFTYLSRWTRNAINSVPVVGDGVTRINGSYNSSISRATFLENIVAGSANNAVIGQVARPYGIYGQDMADVSFAPTTRAALNVGFLNIGVAIGTYASIPSIQGYGAANAIDLNPVIGVVRLGQAGADVATGTNEFFGRNRLASQTTSSNLTPAATTALALINCSGGNRTVTLTNITHSPGRVFTAKKTDSGANLLIVTPASGTIDGGANFSSAAAFATVTIVSDGTNWFSI